MTNLRKNYGNWIAVYKWLILINQENEELTKIDS